MLLLSIFLPLFSAILAGCFGRFIGTRGAQFITIISLASSLLFVVLSFFFFETSVYYQCYTWCFFDNFQVNIEFLFDHATFVMLFVVLTVSLIVHIYSTQYLANDPHLPRFLSYLSLFTFFMLILISAENLIQLFLGWEGVGICSYLLINFWFTRIQANKAALKAVFVNKIGDLALLIALSLTYLVTGALDFSTIFATLPYIQNVCLVNGSFSFDTLTLIAFLLLLGAVGKSAQLGLHVWLPDAMEGPTPVSALLHAATMVTAGIFLIIRCSFLFEHTPGVQLVALVFGSLTAFFAATVGLAQNDLKRIIAFSTCSQLGYMLVSCSLSQYSLSLFHLFNHAFFKALLFLAAGSVIHALYDEQDIRKMGGLFYFLPLTFTFFFIASLSLMGIPYLSGFYSKDLIIEHTWINHFNGHGFATLLLISAAFFTAAYSARLFYYVFLTKPNFFFSVRHAISEPSWITQIPLTFLAVSSIFSGYLGADFFVGFGTTFFNGVLPTTALIDIEFLPFWKKQLPLITTIFSFLGTFWLLQQPTTLRYVTGSGFYYVFCFLNQKWFFDKIYNFVALRYLQRIYFSILSYLDKGLVEYVGPFGFSNILYQISFNARFLQSGLISNYVFIIFFSLFSFLILSQFFI